SDVLVQAGDFFHADAGGGDDLVAGDDRADMDFAQGDIDAELGENAEQVFGVAGMLFLAVRRRGFDLLLEERERRKLVVIVGLLRNGCLGFFGFLRFDDVEGDLAGGGGGGFLVFLGFGLFRRLGLVRGLFLLLGLRLFGGL